MSATGITARGEQPKFPKAEPLRPTHVEKANSLVDCSDKCRRYHRRRIEAFGRINRQTLRDLGAVIRRSK